MSKPSLPNDTGRKHLNGPYSLKYLLTAYFRELQTCYFRRVGDQPVTQLTHYSLNSTEKKLVYPLHLRTERGAALETETCLNHPYADRIFLVHTVYSHL